MIIGNDRNAVINNIKNAAESGDFYKKTETGDPVLTSAMSREITDDFLGSRNRLTYKIKRAFCLAMVKTATKKINKETEFTGLEKIPDDLGGVIITTNHFNQFENTIIRALVTRLGRRHLGIISQISNFAMGGTIGFIMRYADTIPISTEPRYLARGFMTVLEERLVQKKQAVLLYPEQEMWFNYRKPRPPKNGAYFFAAKLSVPVLSCFTEIIDTEKDENNPDFKCVKYRLHILGVLYPDHNKSVKENTEFLAQSDYKLKKECYETVYGKPLTYNFEQSDIAGWKGDI